MKTRSTDPHYQQTTERERVGADGLGHAGKMHYVPGILLPIERQSQLESQKKHARLSKTEQKKKKSPKSVFPKGTLRCHTRTGLPVFAVFQDSSPGET